MSSPEPHPAQNQRGSLRAVAWEAITHTLSVGREPELDPSRYPAELREPGASFVTLHLEGDLRGCTGSLKAIRPLVCDVARNACRSAFRDPRLPPVGAGELAALAVSVSVLSPLEPLEVASERELLAALEPGVDGLVLSEGTASATFLPAVWKSLSEPRDFLEALRRKAGLAPGHWSPTLRFERYTVTEAA
jgi:AmmeMemoRadiSam system protein A